MLPEVLNQPPWNPRLVIVILALSLLLMPACKRSTSDQEQLAQPPVFQPQGHGTVEVKIENPDSLAISLFQIQGNQSHWVEDLNQTELTKQTIELDSGLFVIRSKISEKSERLEIAIPVPALALDSSSKISIQVQHPPEPVDGWCWIPPGPAIVGDTLGVGREDERPARIVEVNGFWMAEKEVTNLQYAEFLSQQKEIPAGWIDLESRKCLIKLDANSKKYSVVDSVESADEMPVVMVSLQGALAYCKWLSKKLGHQVRLPSESEWEKAARGPESFVYSYGNIYKQSLANQESGKLKPVGSYKPNSFGLYDMTGNAFEWMSDRADPTKSETTLNHSLRGGSFVLDGMYLRNSFRMKQSPTVMTDDIGFRVVSPALHKDTDQSYPEVIERLQR